MSTIVTRSGKGSPLTNNEVDANFTNLNTDKVQVTGTPTTGQAIVWNGAAWVPGASAVYPGAGIPVSTGTAWGTSYGTSGATSVVLRDANVNVSANTFFTGFSNVAAAGTTTTLTASSTPNFVVTGSGGQTYQLPDATTLPTGAIYTFNNNQSSGTIVVKNNSGTTIATLQSGSYIEIILLTNSIAAGTWDYHNQAPSNASWSTNTFDYSGSITSATWNGATIATNRGGTGLSTYTAGDLPYYASGTALSKLGIGSSGQILTSTGSAPQWSTLSGVAVTTFSAGTTGLTPNSATSGAITLSGTLATTNGGTGLSGSTPFTANGVVYASSTSALATGSALTFDGSTFKVSGTGSIITKVQSTNSAASLYLIADTQAHAGYGAIQLGDGTNWNWAIGGGLTTNVMTFSTGGTEAMRINSSGYLGIGTSSPNRLLELSGAASNETYQLRLGAGSTNSSFTYDIGRSTVDGYLRFYGNQSAAQGYIFGGANGEYARLDYSGNLLVGTTGALLSTNTFFKTSGASQPCLYLFKNSLANTDQAFCVANGVSGGTVSFQVLASGNAQNTNNSYGAISDIKLKENIVDATPKLADLMQVKIRNYNFKSDETKAKQIGVVAQELESVFPAMIEETSDADKDGNSLGTTTKSVKYSVFVPMLIKAIQELSAKVTALEAKLGV